MSLRSELVEWIRRFVADALKVPPESIGASDRFRDLGVDSAGAGALVAGLAEHLSRRLAATVVWEHPTIDALARHLAGERRAVAATKAWRRSTDEPIAIVGMSCRFPKANDRRAYWRLLRNGVDAVTEVPRERWKGDALYDRNLSAPGKMNTRWGGFLDDIAHFDAAFFHLSPREARAMDPQQRLMLELAWEAFEDADMRPHALRGSRTGVFFGVVWADYNVLTERAGLEAIGQYTVTGFHHSIVANRVSYVLGLEGPSLALDTACSSSLVALHLACDSLRRGESQVAVAGGVNLNIVAESTLGVSKFGGLSSDGRCFTFDARANGYVRGEGAGIVVLKPLSRALADGDRVYCVINGSAVNNNGAGNGLTAPSPTAQQALLREAYEAAKIDPAEVDYVEARGTGTQLGDPIEALGMGAVFGDRRSPDRPLRIGSVKTNIGHLEAASGIAGIIKTALSISRHELPRSLHFETPNPHIDFDALGLRVQTTHEPWPSSDRAPLAGVSSFGFGGTNCHVVMQGLTRPRPSFIALSARSDLEESARSARVESSERDARPGAFDFAPEPGEDKERLVALARNPGELRAQLEGFVSGADTLGLSRATAEPSRFAPVFVFSGQGSQWQGMGVSLLATEPLFRSVVERCNRVVVEKLGFSLTRELTADVKESRLDQIDVSLPAIIAVEIAITELLQSWGLRPAAIVGHSIGEISASYAAGVLTLEEAMSVICAQAKTIRRISGQGTMAVVGCAWDRAGELVSQLGLGAKLCCAIEASPDSTVVSGTPEAIAALLVEAEALELFVRPIKVDVAAHSSQLDPHRKSLRELTDGIAPSSGAIPLYSTVTGRREQGQFFDADYWVRNLAEPVYLSRAVSALLADGFDTFVEISPHPIVKYSLEACFKHVGSAAQVLGTLRHGESDLACILETAGKLYLRGASLRNPAPTEPRALLVLSAPSEEGLRAQASSYSAFLEETTVPFADIAYSALHHRETFSWRLAIVASSVTEAKDKLDRHLRGEAVAATGHADQVTEEDSPEAWGEGSSDLQALGEAWVRGAVDLRQVGALAKGRRVDLPHYAFVRSHYWVDTATIPVPAAREDDDSSPIDLWTELSQAFVSEEPSPQ